MHSDELLQSIHQEFTHISVEVLTYVRVRVMLVLHLIYSGNGLNEVIEEYCKKLNWKLLDPEKLLTVPETFKLDKYKCESESSSGDESDDNSTNSNSVDKVIKNVRQDTNSQNKKW